MLSVRLIRVLVAVAFGIGMLTVSPAMAQRGSRGMAPGSASPGPQKTRRYTPPRFAPTGKILVAEVRLKGKLSQSESRIRAKLQTRAGRRFDPAAVQADVRQRENCCCGDPRLNFRRKDIHPPSRFV